MTTRDGAESTTRNPTRGTQPAAIRRRIAAADWPALGAALDARGVVIMPALLDAEACAALAALYADPARFRSRIVMNRHGFGSGEYQYFAYPLPPVIGALRESLFPQLVPIANRWHEALRNPVRFPATHTAFIERCHRDGQTRPTPLLLKYEAGDYNCLHQDLYGEHVFPLQVTILLSRPARGAYRVKMRHGVSRLHSGSRFTAGIIFHDAR